jgi:periplasmic copper chaperone A
MEGKMKKALCWLLGFTILISCSPAPRSMLLQNAWARPGFAGGTSGIYFTINNSGGSEDELLSASTEVARVVELHRSSMDSSGTMRMERQETIPVAQNSTVLLEPGGLHVMLINLTQDLNPGGTFELILTFRQRGQVSLTVTVREPG